MLRENTSDPEATSQPSGPPISPNSPLLALVHWQLMSPHSCLGQGLPSCCQEGAWAGDSPLFCVCQTASAMPHRPENTKNTASWSAPGLHSRRAIIQDRWVTAPGVAEGKPPGNEGHHHGLEGPVGGSALEQPSQPSSGTIPWNCLWNCLNHFNRLNHLNRLNHPLEPSQPSQSSQPSQPSQPSSGTVSIFASCSVFP